METIGQGKIWSYFDEKAKPRPATCTEIRRGSGHSVSSYFELATKVADLQFRNRGHVLLFRGQVGDYRNKAGNSTLKPTIFRSATHDAPFAGVMIERFRLLDEAERELVTAYCDKRVFLGHERLKRYRIIRWAILQHYEICGTPLLDVTHSLRIAASFASLGKQTESYLFVLGVPQLAGAIAVSADAGLQVVRLSSVCPPSAVRPHIQEGYLLGEYPEMAGYKQKAHYKAYEIDFGRRLVAKFKFDGKKFWKDRAFPKVHRDALYPLREIDPLAMMAEEVRGLFGTGPD